MPPAAKKRAASKAKVIAAAEAPKPADLPAGFQQEQAGKAVTALLKHAAKLAEEKEDTDLFSKDEHVWLVINTKEGSTRKKLMPVKMCREYKDLLASNNIKFIERVVGVDKFRGKFRPYEPRRQLRDEHEIFLADEALIPMLPALLGKMFFEAKKQPIPVNLKRKDLKAELGRAIQSAYFHPSTGTSHAIRIATAGHHSAEQATNNVLAALPVAVALCGGWANVLSAGVKTSSSVFLPVWSSKLDGRFTAADGADADVAMEEKPAPAKEKAVAPAKKAKAAAVAPTKKKTSTIGSGAARKSKVAVVGTGKKAKA